MKKRHLEKSEQMTVGQPVYFSKKSYFNTEIKLIKNDSKDIFNYANISNKCCSLKLSIDQTIQFPQKY